MRLERGDIHGILGANGSGKSTLIRLISGLLTLDSGRVEVFGHDIEREEMAVKRLINRVSVDAAFFKKLSPMENLLFAARLYGLDGKAAKRDALAILARLGIGEKRVGRPVEQMSRGMQQKVAIARALLTSPTLLLLDEPTTGLDPRSKLDVQTFIEEINADPRRDDRPDDPRPGRGRAPVRPDHGPQRRPDRRRGHAGRAQGADGRAARPGTATLEDVFMTYTGRSLDDDVEEDESRRRRRLTTKGGENHAYARPMSRCDIARELPGAGDRASRHRAPLRVARVRPSAGPSAAASSRSASGSPRSHRSSWLGPAKGRASSPDPGDPLVTIVAHELKASYAFIERNFFLTRRYWGWELAFLVYSVAGALSISLIGADQGNPELLLTLMVGAIFWNYLSVVFSWIAETISVERWEGTLEYTFMAPVRRWAQLLGSVPYAMVYGLVHTAVIFVVLVLFFPQLDFSRREPGDGRWRSCCSARSASSGIGMIAAILPLLYVERGAQMTFVLQSCLLLVSGVYYSVEVLPEWMQVLSRLSPATYVLDGVRAGLVDGTPVTELTDDVWPLIVIGVVLIPFGLWAFGRAERYAKRTGKLKRVG